VYTTVLPHHSRLAPLAMFISLSHSLPVHVLTNIGSHNLIAGFRIGNNTAINFNPYLSMDELEECNKLRDVVGNAVWNSVFEVQKAISVC
jgi:hypothetical protein